jgi:hypothetical protein
MAETKSARFSKAQTEAIEDMVEQGKADNQSEAHRMFVNAGMREYGYVNGGYTDTVLKQATHEAAKWFLVAGLVLVGVTYFYPVSLRLVAIGPIVSGLFLMGVERVLESHEPKVSNKIKGLFGGETA